MHSDGVQVYNCHVPTMVKPSKGSAKPFLDYIGYLVPKKREQKYLLQWIATLVARPDVRMKYGLLLVSEEQGIGKSTLCDHILAPLVGLAHGIVDLVATGRTLRENGLVEREEIFASSARLIVNRVSQTLRAEELAALVERMGEGAA